MQGQYNGQENVELIHNIRAIKEEVNKRIQLLHPNRQFQEYVMFEHVKGHCGEVWNTRADELANQGYDTETAYRVDRDIIHTYEKPVQ